MGGPRFKFAVCTPGKSLSPSGDSFVLRVDPRDTHTQLEHGGPAWSSESSMHLNVKATARKKPRLSQKCSDKKHDTGTPFFSDDFLRAN